MAGFGDILRRITGRLREQEGAPSPAASPDAGSASMPDLPAGTPVAAGQEALSFGSEAAPGPMVDLPSAMVAEPVGSNPAASTPVASVPVDVGQIRLPDDDAVAEDSLLSDCPYCGQSDQRIGTRCQRCSRVVVRLPAWAQHRRHNWLFKPDFLETNHILRRGFPVPGVHNLAELPVRAEPVNPAQENPVRNDG